MSNIYDITILQNASFAMNMSLLQDNGSASMDVTGWSFTGSIKRNFSEPSPELFFTCSVVSYATASLNLYLGADSTWLLTGSKYYYDVLAYNPTVTPPQTYRLMQGTVYVDKGVTEPTP